MVKSYTLRRATRDDASTVYSLATELAEYEGLRHTITYDSDTMARYLFGDVPKAYAVIAFDDDNEPAGQIIYTFSFSTFSGHPTLYLEDIYVRECHRRHGVAEMLFKELARVAHDNECQRIEWLVQKDNETAIKFYRRMGGVENVEWTPFLMERGGIDALLSK